MSAHMPTRRTAGSRQAWAMALIVAMAATLLSAIAPVDAASSDLEITELLASNSAGLLDEDGQASDWLEIHNAGATPVDLTGMSLTDDASNPTKWQLPTPKPPQPALSSTPNRDQSLNRAASARLSGLPLPSCGRSSEAMTRNRRGTL